MKKFIFKIIDKIHNWIAKQERKCLEDAIYGLCSQITDKYHDIRLKCYYDKYNPNAFMIHVNEIYANNTGFKEYINKELDYFRILFPEVLVIWGHYNPVDSVYYDSKRHERLYLYNY